MENAHYSVDDDTHSAGIVEALPVVHYSDETSELSLSCHVGPLLRPCCEVGLYGKDICGTPCAYRPDKAETPLHRVLEDVEVEY